MRAFGVIVLQNIAPGVKKTFLGSVNLYDLSKTAIHSVNTDKVAPAYSSSSPQFVVIAIILGTAKKPHGKGELRFGGRGVRTPHDIRSP